MVAARRGPESEAPVAMIQAQGGEARCVPTDIAQCIAVCRRSTGSQHVTNSPVLAWLARGGAHAESPVGVPGARAAYRAPGQNDTIPECDNVSPVSQEEMLDEAHRSPQRAVSLLSAAHRASGGGGPSPPLGVT